MSSFQCKLLRAGAVVPSRNSIDDAGFDVSACFESKDVESITIKPMERAVVSTGISISFSNLSVVQVWPRSGLAVKNGLMVMAGVIDSCYTGEVKVVLFNASSSDVTISRGDRIAQLLPVRLFETTQTTFSLVDTIKETVRGANGFGSSGK